ncbi:MAG: protein kinase [Bacillota bacterium]|nr:protein kinase [Bacillota bacterium]
MPYCSYCGTKNPDDNDFCSKCGSSLTGGTGQLNPDTVLEGRYVIVKTLGRGGMGAVYLALDQRLNNIPVAIKEMSTNAVGHGKLQAAIAAFKKEATMLISLRHPALPRITDFFARGKDRWYLVMDYIEGETLRAVVQRRGPIPQKEVLDWANQLCSILDYLHSQQPPVIFRDLKPANIMLTPDGKIKLIDFGIARHFRPGLTSDTIAYGSSGFAPPEQYGENQTDPRSDIYALGATLHYLLTGIDPGKNPFSFEPPGKFAQVSAGLESAIMRALELKPENRPANIKEMLAVITGENESNTGTSETTSLLPEAGTGTGETLDTLPDLVEEQIETTEMLDEPAQELDEPTELIAEEESENEAEVQPEVTETLYIDNTNQEMNNAPGLSQPIPFHPKDQTPVESKVKPACEFPVAQPTINNKIKWVAAIAGIVIMLSVGWYGMQHFKYKYHVYKYHIALEAQDTPKAQVTPEKVKETMAIIRNRLNALGVSEPIVQMQGINRIIIEIAGVSDPDEALDISIKTAYLEFKTEDGKTVLTGKYLQDARAQLNPNTNQPELAVKFNKEGTRIFERVTTANVNKRIAIYLDNYLLTDPVVSEPITTGDAVICGEYKTLEEAQHDAVLLRFGALPVKLEVIEKKIVGPA